MVRSAMPLDQPLKSFFFAQNVLDAREHRAAFPSSKFPTSTAVDNRAGAGDNKRLAKRKLPNLQKCGKFGG